MATPIERYQVDLKKAGFYPDPLQEHAVQHTQRLYEELVRAANTPPRWRNRLRGRRPAEVKGLYLWGGTGRGKTYLVDSFYDCLPLRRVRRPPMSFMSANAWRSVSNTPSAGFGRWAVARIWPCRINFVPIVSHEEMGMWRRMILLLVLGAVSLAGCQSVSQSKRPPFADIHLHYNWDQDEIYTPEQAINDLREHNVVLAVVSSVPSDFALKLSELGENWIVPFYTPYYDAGNRLNWFYDEKVVDKAREALASGKFYGLGEIHLVAGVGPRRDNPVFLGLLSLAKEYNVPVNIHTDTSRYEYMLSICEQHPEVRFQWAHVGGILQPEAITPLMEACPNVWADMSARDPLHYGGFFVRGEPIPEDWREWMLRFQDRIMVGTDPVSGGHEVYTWYKADDGWNQYGALYDYHRGWMDQLPPEVGKKIRLTNAQRFFDYALQKMNQ